LVAPNQSRETGQLGTDPLERLFHNATRSPASAPQILFAGAIVRQTGETFTNARRFQLPDAFDDALFSDRACPKTGHEFADAIRTLGCRLWASKTRLFCATIWDIQRIASRADVLHRGERQVAI
jgi:hypothetical protein